MKNRNLFLAAGIGFAIGYLVCNQMKENQQITPEKALSNAKEAFKRTGPISGSWIYMKPEEIERNGLVYHAYRGGITRNIDGENKQYEFYVDVETGGIIDVLVVLVQQFNQAVSFLNLSLIHFDCPCDDCLQVFFA